MPRKIKTAFTATDEDVAITGIHDIGFIPRERDGVRGVEIRVGGGTSIMPRVAPTLYDFVELDNGDYLKVSEAVFRIFDRQEWLRVNRARARIKVLIDKIGIDAFREMVEEELEGDWVDERDFSIDHLVYGIDEEANAPAPAAGAGQPERRPLASSTASAAANVQPAAPGGLLHGRGQGHPRRPDARSSSAASAQIMREYTGGSARTTVHQNFVLRWVRDEAVYDVWQRLGELGLDDAGADEITDVVSCPGTDSCKLGITSSMGLNRAIQERVESMQITDPLTKRVHIKMSGCPNGCSQHHIANIGFYGASLKVGGRHDARLHPAPRRQLRGRRGRLRPPAEGAAARQARPRRGRALAAPLRGRARRRRGVQRLRRAGRHRRASRPRSRSSRCRPSSASRR